LELTPWSPYDSVSLSDQLMISFDEYIIHLRIVNLFFQGIMRKSQMVTFYLH